uniref:Uncharacterized protein n=1 Tax=viral metagenome TaxID=1070528 RepID=A0A6C0KYV6_9ZZZZ
MATIGSGSSNLNNTSRRHYVSCEPFYNDFFTYSNTTSFLNGNWTTVGTLTPVAGATKANCPQGRVLRENGKKMYPDANPGVKTYMVGVYDDTTFLSGFINPNSPIFTPMNMDKPTYMPNGADPDVGTYAGLQNVGTGSYTQGTIYAGDLSGAGIGLGNGFYAGLSNGFSKDLSGTIYAAMYQRGPAQASSLQTDGFIGIETGTNGDHYVGNNYPFDISGGGVAVFAGMYNNGTIQCVSNLENSAPFGIISVYTDPDLSGAYAATYIPGPTFFPGPADTDLGIETGKEANGVFAGLYSNGTIFAVSSEDEQNNGIYGNGIINASTNPDLSGAYGSMYTYRSTENVPNARMGVEAGTTELPLYAGLYSDGTIEAISTIKGHGGLTVGGGSFIANIYYGTATFTIPSLGDHASGSASATLSGVGNSSLLMFPNPNLGDSMVFFRSYSISGSTVTIYFGHPTGGNSHGGTNYTASLPYFVINPVPV